MQALQAELEARSAALAAAHADTSKAADASAEVERLQAQLERVTAERDDLAADLDRQQQVVAAHTFAHEPRTAFEALPSVPRSRTDCVAAPMPASLRLTLSSA